MGNRIFLLLVVFLLIPNVLANGLSLIGGNYFNINKTQGVDYPITIQIKNEEPFTFYNINFEDSSVISMSEISQLDSGNSVNVTATIKTDSNFDSNVNIIGFYEAQLGALNETYEVDIDFVNGINPCDITLVKGDKLHFVNNVLDDVVMRNYDTGNDIRTISEGTNYTMEFNTPQVLSYYFLRWGVPFGGVCTVTVLNDNGLVHNSDYDTVLNLKVNMNYKPTTLQASFLTDYYEMDFDDELEDIFSLKNNGSETAKNIKISSNWISFEPNNFDLNSGVSRNIAYTIKPFIISTEQTNKTYSEIIKIEGNFPTIEKNVTIFINYERISSDYVNTTINDEIIGYLIEKYCEDHPEKDVCQRKVIKIVNESDQILTYNTTERDFNKIWTFQFEEAKKDREFENFMKDYMYYNNLTTSEMRQNQTELFGAVLGLEERMEHQTTLSIFFSLLSGFLVGFVLLIVLIYNQRITSKIKGFFSKGESEW